MKKGNHTYIIAEIGTNHGGDLSRTKELVTACAKAGVDAVKFQTWKADLLRNPWDFDENGVRHEAEVVKILDKLEFKQEWHQQIIDLCKQLNIDFLSAPFDLESAKFLHSLNVPAIKIASGDITFYELLKEVGTYNIPIILSTGMATADEIQQALDWIGPSHRNLVTLLHCISEYPAPIDEANLTAITSLSEHFNIPVGLSDHFMDDDPAIAAVALGARVLEKHVTFSRQDGFPDSSFAHEIKDLEKLVQRVRLLEKALGNGEIGCQLGEGKGISGGRRGIYAARDIPEGTILKRNDIRVVRPYIGQYRPVDIDLIIGKKVQKTLVEGEPIGNKEISQKS